MPQNNSIRPVKVAVFPVAGLGTRFLPATKAIPKEMLTLVDRPLIEHAVEEARAAGITEFVFVSSAGKTAMEDHFDRNHDLNNLLEKRGKVDALATVINAEIPTSHLSVVRQHTPLGLGHAVWCAHRAVGDQPFAVLLPDDVVLSEKPCLAQMMDEYYTTGGNMIAVQEVPHQHTHRYGIVTPGATAGRRTEVKGMVEKPKAEQAPSNLAIIGRYILQPEIFPVLEHIGEGSGGEIQLTDGMVKLMQQQAFSAYQFEGTRYDCGDRMGWLEANLAFAMARPEYTAEVRSFMKKYAEK